MDGGEYAMDHHQPIRSETESLATPRLATGWLATGLLLTSVGGCYLSHDLAPATEPTETTTLHWTCDPPSEPPLLAALVRNELVLVFPGGRAQSVHAFGPADDVGGALALDIAGRHIGVIVGHFATGSTTTRVDFAIACTNGEVPWQQSLTIPYDSSSDGRVHGNADGSFVFTVRYGDAFRAFTVQPDGVRPWRDPFSVLTAPHDGAALVLAHGPSSADYTWYDVADHVFTPTRYAGLAPRLSAKPLADGILYPVFERSEVELERPTEVTTWPITPALGAGQSAELHETNGTGWGLLEAPPEDVGGPIRLYTVDAVRGATRYLGPLSPPPGLRPLVASRDHHPRIDSEGGVLFDFRDDREGHVYHIAAGGDWQPLGPAFHDTSVIGVTEAAGTYVVYGVPAEILGAGAWSPGSLGRGGDEATLVRPADGLELDLPRSSSTSLPFAHYQLAGDGRRISYWIEEQLYYLDVPPPGGGTPAPVACDVTRTTAADYRAITAWFTDADDIYVNRHQWQ